LHYAAFLGYHQVSSVLLDALPDIFQVDEWLDHDDHTPLHLAVMKGFDKIVDIFLRHPEWTKWDNTRSGKVFLIACSLGHTSIVKMLLEKKVDVSIVNEEGEVSVSPSRIRLI
jgi:ankyrin repeat protein